MKIGKIASRDLDLEETQTIIDMRENEEDDRPEKKV